MVITKKCISRRNVLRGMGAALSLPLLDSMIPALSAAPAPVNRFGAVYVPNGIVMKNWTPASEGAAFEFTPILKPLESFRDRVLVLSGLNSKPDVSNPNLPMGVHSRAATRFLTDVQPKPTEGADLSAGISTDQIAARELGKYTQLASLELGIDAVDSGGTGDSGFSKAYIDTISWRSPTTPLPMENNPRAVFERLFGDTGSSDPAVRLARLHEQRSILDAVTESAKQLQKKLGSSDRSKISEYFEAIRDVERRVQLAEQQSARDLPVVAQPAGIPANVGEHMKLMYDLYLLAYQCDMTRVITLMVGHEFSGRTYTEIGVSDAHHALSHHENDQVRLEKLTAIQTYHMSMFKYFLEKMRSTPDGDGSLLDHSMIVYGAGMSDSNAHDPRNLPMVLVGGGSGSLKGGRHLRFAKETPLANLHMTLLNKLGVHAEKIGDSTGSLAELSA